MTSEFRGPKTLLHECRQCGLKYDSTEALANHVKRFCKESEYGNLKDLERKFQEENNRKKYGLDDPKDTTNKTKSPEEQFKKMLNDATVKRENDMMDELNKYRIEKHNLRLEKNKDEEELAKLVKSVEEKKEKEMRDRIEKEEIRRKIAELDKKKLETIEASNKGRLEKIEAERENLKRREQDIVQELKAMENEKKTLEKLKREDIEKQNEQIDKLKEREHEYKKVGDVLRDEKAEKIANLKVRRELLENDRRRIMDDLDRLRNGDTDVIRRNNSGLLAARQMLGDIKDLGNYSVDHIHERVRNNPTGNRADPITITNQGQANQINSDLRKVRDDYLKTGGNDPAILGAFSNIEANRSQYANAANGGQFNPIYNNPTSPPTQGYANVPNEYRHIIEEKDRERDRLNAELQMLKAQAGTPQGGQGALGNLTLGDMNLRLGGIQPGGGVGMVPGSVRGTGDMNFDKFLGNKEFFVMNEVKSVDLTEEERILVSIAAQEVDALRMLSQVPIGTELYRFKMEQFKELSTTRAEIEKIVQEQRLQKLRRDFEKRRREEDRKYDNEKFVDDWRKQIISTRLRKDLNQDRADRKYDPTEGLVIHWDYCLGVPKRTDYLQMVYGIYINGEEVYAPRMIEPHDCEVDTSLTNRCIIGESHHALDIPSNSNALLIFELQSTTAKDSGKGRVISYAWSQLDIFDARRELRRGKFKIPLYIVPTITSIDIDGIKHLEPVDGGMVWFYLRISYPNNDEFGKQQSLYPENTHFEYVIPQIHLRSFRPEKEVAMNRSDADKPISRKSSGQSYRIQEPSKNFVKEKPSNPLLEMSQSQNNTTLNIPQQPNMRVKDKSDSLQKFTETERSIRQPENSMSRFDRERKEGPRKGLMVIVNTLHGHVARSQLKIACALLQDGDILQDERNQPCAFNTKVHNPSDSSNRSAGQSGNSKANLAQGDDIVFKSEHLFLKDIEEVLRKQKIRKDLYLNFQILEKPEAANYGNSNAGNMSGNSGMQPQMDYELFGWILFKLTAEHAQINTGNFSIKLCQPPLKRPPIDLDRVRTLESDLDFTVQLYEYDDKDLDRTFKSKKGKKPKKKGANILPNISEMDDDN